MKVPRRFVGRMVEVIWQDPGARRVPKQSPYTKGRAALATWRDRGILDDLTDGVLRIVHSDGYSPGDVTSDEIFASWVPEDLVETIVVFVPEPPGPEPSPPATS